MSKLTTWLMRSTSRPRAATSVATRMSRRPDLSWSMVRSRWFWAMSPLMAAAVKPRARSFSASSSVSCLVRTKTIIASNSSTSRTRVSASSLLRWAVMRNRWRMLSAVRVCDLTVISCGSSRYCLDRRRIAAGMVAENSATCLSSGVSARMRSTSSWKPMLSISSASSSTRKRRSEMSSEPFSRWSMTRPGVPTMIWVPRRRPDSWMP